MEKEIWIDDDVHAELKEMCKGQGKFMKTKIRELVHNEKLRIAKEQELNQAAHGPSPAQPIAGQAVPNPDKNR